ncbi:MAG TPA: hypothetical protein VJ691_00265 [Vicinamibacterales bacterium]|nr:hypothetical protein [Vicinamibacterales bacterium]
MSEAWFSPEVARSFAFLSLLAVTAVLEPVAQQGRFRAMVLAVFGACVVLGAAFFAAGGLALLADQPSYVSRSLLLVGFVVTIPFVGAFVSIQKIYREAELRRTVASDL